MIIDKNLQLASAQAVTAAAASTNYIDLSVARDLGNSALQVMITCDQTCTSGGASTVQFQLQVDSSSGFGTVKTILETDALAYAGLTANMAPIFLPIPPGYSKEFLRVYFNVATANLTAGKFTANVIQSAGIQNSPTYAAANYN